MSKFKVGDMVVGNEKANKYGFTVKGWIGTVQDVDVRETNIRVYGNGCTGDRGVWVDEECFDLVNSTQLITIKQKGRKVIAVLTDANGKFIKSAKARYNPDDEKEGKPFDFEIGKKIAIKRLMGEDVKNISMTASLEELGKAVKKLSASMGETSLTAKGFKVGDKIVATKNRWVEIGTKGEIIQLETNPITIHMPYKVRFENGKIYWCYPDDIALHNDTSSFDWESFKSGKFAVHCDTEEKAREFLKECDEQGILWNCGSKASSTINYDRYKADTCYCNYYMDADRIGFCSIDYYREKGIDILDYTPSKPTVKEVHRPAKAGEWIRVVKAEPIKSERQAYKNGDIFKVNKIHACCIEDVCVDGVNYWIDYSEYVVLENYTPKLVATPIENAPQPFRKAKVGDKIKVVKVREGHDPEVFNGDVLTVDEIHGDSIGAINPREGHNWFDDANQEYIILDETKPVFKKAKVSDKIKVVKGGIFHQPEVHIGDVLTVTRVLDERVDTEKNYFSDENEEYEIVEEVILTNIPTDTLLAELKRRTESVE